MKAIHLSATAALAMPSGALACGASVPVDGAPIEGASPRGVSGTTLSVAAGAALHRALWRAPQAEWGLAHQGARVLLSRDQEGGWLVRDAGRHLVALGRPMGRPDLGDLTAAAGRRHLLLYKCDAHTAVRARAAGWPTLRIGAEAVLPLDAWTASHPSCRRLRRKLRAAIAAGLRVAADEAPDIDDLAGIAAAWEADHGPERGFSMGRFDADLLRRQAVVVARVAGRPVAFASFFLSRDEWSLDLMRHRPEVPDGTMHALVAHAIDLARTAGADRLSLAAIPDPRGTARRLLGLAVGAPRGGLAQFKLAFGPALRPLHACAPTRRALVLGLLAVAREVHRPADRGALPLPPQKGFDAAPGPCDARGRPPRPAFIPIRGPRADGPSRGPDAGALPHDRRPHPTARHP